jgi:uncharacterized protein YceH (UPF0502 family)
MEMVLNSIELRVLACLVEKSLATPDYYPLTLNALTVACNQKSNRDPLMQLSDQDTVRALDSLRDRRLAWAVTLAGSRMPKYRHHIEDVFPLSRSQLAVLCELMLRGPQTVSELRTRAARLCDSAEPVDASALVQELMAWPGGALVAVAPRRSGQREERYYQLLGGAIPEEVESAVVALEPARLSVMAENERVGVLEAKVAALEDEVARLKSQFSDFSSQFK